MDTDCEVSSVERVGPVPALWSKLPPLNHHSMEIDQREQDALKLRLLGTHLHCVLTTVERRKCKSNIVDT